MSRELSVKNNKASDKEKGPKKTYTISYCRMVWYEVDIQARCQEEAKELFREGSYEGQPEEVFWGEVEDVEIEEAVV